MIPTRMKNKPYTPIHFTVFGEKPYLSLQKINPMERTMATDKQKITYRVNRLEDK